MSFLPSFWRFVVGFLGIVIFGLIIFFVFNILHTQIEFESDVREIDWGKIDKPTRLV